jgi:hypothetical protein
LAAVAETLVGASGSVAGVTVLDEVAVGLVPTALVDVTENAYSVPLVNPVTVAVVLAAVVVAYGCSERTQQC